MSKPNHLISQETVSEIFALAAELQAQQEQTYSIAELIEIGAEAHIAPEYIKQAFVQIQARNMSAAKRRITWTNFGRMGAVIVLLSLLTSLVSLLNGQSFSVAREQIQNSELLSIEERKLVKSSQHHQHRLTHKKNKHTAVCI
ncbi:MAG: hypothetical protein RLZZ574_2772 [Cyanobacteriota bacterium]|jgi:hypothetical protein